MLTLCEDGLQPLSVDAQEPKSIWSGKRNVILVVVGILSLVLLVLGAGTYLKGYTMTTRDLTPAPAHDGKNVVPPLTRDSNEEMDGAVDEKKQEGSREEERRNKEEEEAEKERLVQQEKLAKESAMKQKKADEMKNIVKKDEVLTEQEYEYEDYDYTEDSPTPEKDGNPTSKRKGDRKKPAGNDDKDNKRKRNFRKLFSHSVIRW